MPELLLEHEFTINADGAGKCALRWHGDPPGGDFDPARFVRQELKEAKGVEAWGEVDCALEDGKLTFTALAYFPDVSKLRFHCQGFHASVMDLLVSKDEKGNLVIANPPPKPPEDDGSGELSDDELRAKLAEERGKLEMARGFIEGIFGGITTVVVIRTPGKMLKVTNAKKEGANGARAQFSGAELLKLFDRLTTDDDLFMTLLRKKVQGPEALMEIAGGIGPLAIVSDGKKESAFDYAAESAAAAERQPALLEKFAAPPPPVRVPVEGFRIAAVKIVREADASIDFSPQSESEPCVQLTVAGTLPSKCLKVEEVRMEVLEAADGRNLLPEDEWNRRVSFPKLAKDGLTAYFDVPAARVPVDGLPGFAKIAGVAICHVAGASEEKDLGFPALEPGAQGEFGAVIERVEQEYEDRWALEFQIQVGVDRIESVSLKRKGVVEVLDQGGYSSSGDECKVTYRLPGEPKKGDRLIAKIISSIETLEVPFAIEDVDLLGRPR